jgi:hypothetical protein
MKSRPVAASIVAQCACAGAPLVVGGGFMRSKGCSSRVAVSITLHQSTESFGTIA